MECVFLFGMTILYWELYSYVKDGHEKAIEGPEIRIPYAICYISRIIIIIVLLIKKKLYKMRRQIPAVADIELT